MSPEILARFGLALYGPRWKSALAADLKVSYATVLRWSRGEFGIPKHIQIKLFELLEKRDRQITELCVVFSREWNPIETLKLDGRHVQYKLDNGMIAYARALPMQELRRLSLSLRDGSWPGRDCEPTHWRELVFARSGDF